MTLAHETWFVRDHDRFELEWSFAGEAATLALLTAAVLVTIAVRLVSTRWSGRDVPFLAAMAPFMPFALRMHLAVSLIGLLSLGYYLSPAMDLQADVAGIALGAVMVLVAISMASGWHAREGAALLILAGPLGALEFGIADVLQRVDMLGVALFVLVAGPGRWSADPERGAAREPSALEVERAVWVLRVAAGLALIAVAFVEKLAGPDLAQAFLDLKPQFDLADQLGLGLSQIDFVRVAGAMEVLFGLLLISGALPQVIVLAAGIPFNATLWFFGAVELMGHLPVYGTMLVLLVYGSSGELRPLVSRAWPWGRRTGVAQPAPG